MKIIQYPRSADGNPLDLLAGVLTDTNGNGGSRIEAPLGPDGAPIDQVGLILLQPDGQEVTFGNVTSYATRAAMAGGTPRSNNRAVYLSEPGREGYFVYTTADISAMVALDTEQGIYVPRDDNASGTLGGWVRRFSDDLEISWFGAVADDATDSLPAFNAAFRMLESLAVPGYQAGTIYRGGPGLHVGKGLYYCSGTLEPLSAFRFHGDGGVGWSGASRIRFPAGVTGLRLQAHNTANADDITANHFAADNVVVEDLAFLGGYFTTMTEGEFHGLHAKRTFHLVRCTFSNFQGDGLFIKTSIGGGVAGEGNTNNSRVTNCLFESNRNGVRVSGADANVIGFLNCDFRGNRQWGSWDTAFLHNNYWNCHSSDNGIVAGMPVVTLVSHAGNRYAVIEGQEAGASTNAPSGTTADNTWWRYAYAGGVGGTIIPAWFNGIAVRAGGSYNGQSWLWGCYEETGQGPCIIDNPGGTYEGLLYNRGTGGRVRAALGYTAIKDLNIERNFITSGGQASFGPQDYSQEILHQYYAANGANLQYYSTGGTFIGQVGFNNFYGAVATRTNFKIYLGPNVFALVEALDVSSVGLNIPTGRKYLVNNVDIRNPILQTVASSATVTPAFGEDQVNITAQAAGLTLANWSGTAIPAWGMAIRIKDNGGAQTIAYGSKYRAIGVTLPATTVAGKTMYLGCIYNATDDKIDVVAVRQEA